MNADSSIKSQLENLEQAVGLLQKTLEAALQKVGEPEEKDARVAFVYRHARNIHDVAKDVVALGSLGRLGSIYLLARPALESLFKLAAATNEPDFAIEKLVAEVEEERKKFEAWSAADEPLWDAVLKEVVGGLKEFETELRQRYEVNRELRWRKAWQVAKAGKLQVEYVRDYFIGSKHVHAMVSALVDREDGLYIFEGLHRLTATACQAAALANKYFCVSPSIFDDALRIESQSIDLFARIQVRIEQQLRAHFGQ